MKNHLTGSKVSKINTGLVLPGWKESTVIPEKYPKKPPVTTLANFPVTQNHRLKKSLPYFIKNQENHYFEGQVYGLRKTTFKVDEDYFKFLMDHAPDSIFIQTSWKFSYLNKNAVQLFGANSPGELIGTPVLERIHSDLKEKVEARIRGLNEKKQVQNLQELVLLRLDGTQVPIETSGIPFTYKGKVGALVFVRDITERKKTQEKLQQALAKAEGINLLKTHFLQNLSHEIRTPLNAIQGFSELLTMNGFTDEKKGEFLDNIRKSIQELSNLISKSVTLALLESGLESVNLVPTSFEVVLDDLLDCFSGSSTQKEIPILLKKSSREEVKFMADKEKVFTVLFNLIENAFKFTTQGKVEFGYEDEIGHVLFFVRDTGPGIPDEFKELIFDRFFQIENINNKSHSGLGLGLSISQSLTHMMCGKIWVESEVGKGSDFYLKIPVVSIGQR